MYLMLHVMLEKAAIQDNEGKKKIFKLQERGEEQLPFPDYDNLHRKIQTVSTPVNTQVSSGVTMGTKRLQILTLEEEGIACQRLNEHCFPTTYVSMHYIVN